MQICDYERVTIRAGAAETHANLYSKQHHVLCIRVLQSIGDLARDHGEESLAKCTDMQGTKVLQPYVGDGGAEF